MIRFFFLFLVTLALSLKIAEAQETPTPATASNSMPGAPILTQTDLKDQPTFIDADSLTLKSKDRIFIYTGNVVVKNGDMTLTSDNLEGTYNEKNEIQTLTALKNVNITKGEKLKANSEKALYEAKTQIVTLTENPQIDQEGSILTADVIKLYLDEDRSVAEGQVRMKVVKVQPTGTVTPIASPSPTKASEEAALSTEATPEPLPSPTPTEAGFWPF